MKLKRLDLKAFGPFTNRIIEFNADGPGLHIIFGPNEAGKSSSLRALKALLYGFEQTTPDNFIHSYDQLLVGGCLENGTGEEIVFYRRKKRKGDVVDVDGNPLDAGVLSPFIHGVEPEIFQSLYGIDHDALVRGGEEILDQKGEVGQALFAAGAGISSLRGVIDQLENEAADLFKPAGQKPQINRAVRRFRALQKEVKAATLSIKDWKAHRKILKNAEKERNRLQKEREDKNRELYRFDRLKQAIPELAALKTWQDQLLALGEVVLLSPGFAEKHRQVDQAMRDAKLRLHKDTERLVKIERKRGDISFNKAFLSYSEKVDDFHQRLGEYRKGQKDRPERNGQRINLRTEAARLLKLVRPDLALEEVETLRSVLIRKKTLQNLSSQFDAINHQLAHAKKQRKAAERERKEIEKGLAAMPEAQEAEDLFRAVKLAQKAGNIDVQLQKGFRAVELKKKNCLSELKRMGLWSGDLEGLMALSCPLSETLRQYENRFSKIDDKRREIERARLNTVRDLKNARVEIKRVAYAGEIPSEEELTHAREKREQGWQLLRRQWFGKEDVVEESRDYHSELPLAEAYEGNVEEADIVADRLRREADRVAKAADLRARVEALEAAWAENDKDKEAIDQRLQELEAAWIRQWQQTGITPLSPKEMSGWLMDMEKLRSKGEDLLRKEQEIEQDVMRRNLLRQALRNELLSIGEVEIPEGETLDPVLLLADTVLERIDGRKRDFEKLRDRKAASEKAFHQAGEDLEVAEKALAEWQAQWEKAVSGLGAAGEVSTFEALDLIETLQSCFDKLKEADDLKKRINGIDRDAAALEAEVRTLAEEAAPDLSTLPPDQIILKLRTLISQAQRDGTLYEELSAEIDALQEEISAAQKDLQSANEQMDELLGMAKCETSEALPAVIDTFEKYQALREKIAATEETLARVGAGVMIEELSRQASEVDADELPVLMASLRRDIEERINPDIDKTSQVIGEESLKLAAMDGSAKAADTAEEMEQVLAGIRRFSERYALLKLASRILQQEIERYREEHQGPVLKIASGYFNDLTVGSFAGLRTDVDDKGAPILVGVRPDDRRLTVKKMSSGTRDQLFLALRLATLEWRLETSEPMPFIVDDILINFDDDRSRATLAALADLSIKNQVILFTHHRQIVEAANGVKGKGTIQIHAL